MGFRVKDGLFLLGRGLATTDASKFAVGSGDCRGCDGFDCPTYPRDRHEWRLKSGLLGALPPIESATGDVISATAYSSSLSSPTHAIITTPITISPPSNTISSGLITFTPKVWDSESNDCLLEELDVCDSPRTYHVKMSATYAYENSQSARPWSDYWSLPESHPDTGTDTLSIFGVSVSSPNNNRAALTSGIINYRETGNISITLFAEDGVFSGRIWAQFIPDSNTVRLVINGVQNDGANSYRIASDHIVPVIGANSHTTNALDFSAAYFDSTIITDGDPNKGQPGPIFTISEGQSSSAVTFFLRSCAGAVDKVYSVVLESSTATGLEDITVSGTVSGISVTTAPLFIYSQNQRLRLVYASRPDLVSSAPGNYHGMGTFSVVPTTPQTLSMTYQFNGGSVTSGAVTETILSPLIEMSLSPRYPAFFIGNPSRAPLLKYVASFPSVTVGARVFAAGGATVTFPTTSSPTSAAVSAVVTYTQGSNSVSGTYTGSISLAQLATVPEAPYQGTTVIPCTLTGVGGSFSAQLSFVDVGGTANAAHDARFKVKIDPEMIIAPVNNQTTRRVRISLIDFEVKYGSTWYPAIGYYTGDLIHNPQSTWPKNASLSISGPWQGTITSVFGCNWVSGGFYGNLCGAYPFCPYPVARRYGSTQPPLGWMTDTNNYTITLRYENILESSSGTSSSVILRKVHSGGTNTFTMYGTFRFTTADDAGAAARTSVLAAVDAITWVPGDPLIFPFSDHTITTTFDIDLS